MDNLTNYQKLLIDNSNKKFSAFYYLMQFLSVVSIFGLFCLYNETLPSFLVGWLTILNFAVVFAQIFIVAATSLIFFIIYFVKKIILNIDNYGLIHQEDEKTLYKSRYIARSFIKCGILRKRPFIGFLNDIVDIGLFILLVTNNYAFLAILSGFSLIAGHFLIKRIKKNLFEVLQNLPDPFENDNEDIDKLMNKLCEPDDTNK